MPHIPTKLMPYDEMRGLVRSGDLLLWRPTSLVGKIICLGTSIGTRRWVRHSHASMAAWGMNQRLYHLEMLQGKGGRHVPLSRHVAKYPRSCEVWRPVNPSFDGEGAVRAMLWLMGQHYGWSDFAKIVLRNLLPHFVLPLPANTDDPDEPRVCSTSYAWAARIGGGVAPLPDQPDLVISPADLAQSGFASYLATPFL